MTPNMPSRPLNPQPDWRPAPESDLDPMPIPPGLDGVAPPAEGAAVSSVPMPGPPAPSALRRSPDVGDRIMAVVEILFACGILTNIAAVAFVATVFEIRPDDLLKNPQMMFYFLLADTVFLLMTIHLFLRQHHQSFRDLGLQPRALATNVGLGLLSVVGLMVLTGVASVTFRDFFPEYYQQNNPMLEGIKTPADLGFFIASGILAGGVREEIQRAFVLTRFQRYLFGLWPGLILWSAFFGYMHYSTQGLQGAVITGLIGLCLGLLFIWRRSLYGPITGHAAFNTIQLIWFWSRLHQ